MTKTIVVLGATGNQGGSVVRTFLSKGWHVRGVTRSTTSPAAQALISKGVELVTADIDIPSTLVSAFKGAHVIFAMTDFWETYFSKFPSFSKISDRATGEYAMNIEIQRGKNLVDAAERVLKDDGILERFIYSTLPPFKDVSGGKYTYIYHYDGKAVVSEYLKANKDLWARSSLFNAGFYASNIKNYDVSMWKSESVVDGKYIMRQPGAIDALHPLFVTEDTGAFVDLLVRSPPGQDLLGVSEMASYQDFMKLWTEVTGVPSEVREITVEDLDKAIPGGLGREYGESAATSAEFGWGKHLVLPKDLDPNIKTTSMKSWIENEDWTSFLRNLNLRNT